MPITPRPLSALRAFVLSESAGGLLLMVAAAAAMLVANGPAGPRYFGSLAAYIGPLSLLHWINDGLMALFFLLVGLEIKREFVDGHLASWGDRALPVAAAAGGMIAPAIVYLLVAGGDPALVRGWAIPAATDIAFAMGVLALLGPRVPASLKLFLATVAIVDDMGAVTIIALFYTADLDPAMLAAAAAILALMVRCNRRGETRLSIYLFLAALLWLAVLRSGVHATIAGVLAALTIPLRRTPGAPDAADSPLHRLEHALQPWVAFLVVPLFGFANAGVSLAGVTPATLVQPLPLGIIAGLFVGKQVGILAAVALAVGLGGARRPAGASWMQVYGIALIAGIGFTMSLFIGGLAFPDPLLATHVKLGVLGGSALAGLGGVAVLLLAAARRPAAAG